MPARPLFADGALLVGDAAGLAYPKSGEGIRPAVESGLLAARTIIEARGDYSARRLATYPERLRARFGDGEGPADSFADLLPAGIRALLARGLFGHPGLLKRVVLDRGFLHTNQPALAPVPDSAP